MRPKKSLSQNFLIDQGAAKRIVDSLDLSQDDMVLEIGTGKGALTKYLLEKARKVFAVEIDKRLCDYLHRTFGGSENLEIIQQNILKMDFTSLVDSPGKLKVVGNLPYKITSPVLELLLEQKDLISLCVLMVQKEVAARIGAHPGSRDWSPLSIAIQLRSEVEILFHLKPGSFSPAPRVESSVIRLAFLPTPRVSLPDGRFFFHVVKSAFGQRRKILLNSLSANLSLPKRELTLILNEVHIDPQRRPETLSIEEYAVLISALSKVVK
jgi:16S rRNA (adenine1518-N6/adenine1519-N6)-dimethyltransferase